MSQSLSAALARGQIPLTRQDTEECCVSNWENNSGDEKVHLERWHNRKKYQSPYHGVGPGVRLQRGLILWIKFSYHFPAGDSAGSIHSSSDQLWIGGEGGGGETKSRRVEFSDGSGFCTWSTPKLINDQRSTPSEADHSVDGLFMHARHKTTHTQSIIAIFFMQMNGKCQIFWSTHYCFWNGWMWMEGNETG